jgi:hypothetical protein
MMSPITLPNVSQVASEVASQMLPKVTQVVDEILPNTTRAVQEIVPDVSRAVQENLEKQGKILFDQTRNIVSNVVVPAYRDTLGTGIDTAKKIALKEYNTRVEQLKILNEAAERFLGTSKRIQNVAEDTGKMVENIIDNLGDSAINISTDVANKLLTIQKGGQNILHRVKESKEDFMKTGLPLFDIVEII